MIEYNAAQDVLYVNINSGDSSVSSTKTIDSRRVVDYAEDGSVIAVHFLQSILGIELEGIPEQRRIESALQQLRTVLQRVCADTSNHPPRSGRTG